MRFSSRLFPLVIKVAFGVAVASFGTGCGALGALANPKAAWAISEPAPMSVVVRRAEVAHETARQVDRLLGQTPIDDKSAWTPKTALKTEVATAVITERAGDPVYRGVVKLRVVPAEVWLDTLAVICSDESKYPNLIASISPELAKSYGEVTAQAKEIADIKSKIAIESAAIDDKAEAANQAAHEGAKHDLEARLEKAQSDAGPKIDAFLSTLKDEAAKASPESRARVGVAVVNLRRAVEDAKLANAVALVRYPLAMPGFKDDVQLAAARIAADVIEERTGTRPEASTLKISATLAGTDVKLTITGAGGSVSAEELLAETTKRTKDYVGRVLTLVGYAGETQDELGFEGQVLTALADGMGLGTPGADAGADIGDLKAESSMVPGPKPAKPKTGIRSATGIVVTSCAVEAPKVVAVVAPPAAPLKAKVVKAHVAMKSAPRKPATSKAVDCDVTVSSGDGDAKLCL